MDNQSLRVELACALRWCAKYDLHEGVANHFSVATDDSGEAFLINPAGVHFSAVKASELICAGGQGVPAAELAGVDETAWCLHSYFHRHLPQARCLLHVHSPYATALASLKNWHLLPIDQNACRFFNRVAYDEQFGGMLLAQEEAERQMQAIGDKQVLVMRGHGVLVVGESVATAFDRLYYFERACRNQWLALSTQQPLFMIDDATAEKTAVQWDNYPILHFAELKRLLFATEPDFAA